MHVIYTDPFLLEQIPEWLLLSSMSARAGVSGWCWYFECMRAGKGDVCWKDWTLCLSPHRSLSLRRRRRRINETVFATTCCSAWLNCCSSPAFFCIVRLTDNAAGVSVVCTTCGCAPIPSTPQRDDKRRWAERRRGGGGGYLSFKWTSARERSSLHIQLTQMKGKTVRLWSYQMHSSACSVCLVMHIEYETFMGFVLNKEQVSQRD